MKAKTCSSRRDGVHRRLGKALQPMIPTLARSIELITVLTELDGLNTVRSGCEEPFEHGASAFGRLQPEVSSSPGSTSRSNENAKVASDLAKGAASYRF